MKRKTPLVAKTQLRRGTSQLSTHKPMAPVGTRGGERRVASARTKQIVMEREQGFCEAGCGHAAADPHHLFGRDNQIAWKWGNRPELVAALCRPCHDYLQTHPQHPTHINLQWLGVERLAFHFRRPWGIYLETGWTPLQATRELIRLQEGQE